MGVRATKRTLTEKFLENVKPNVERRTVYWDALVPNFGVRVSDKGNLSFVVTKRPRGQTRIVNHVLGAYPALKLAEARAKAREVLRLLDEGKRPREVEQEKLREQARQRASTFGALAEQFCSELTAGLIPKARGEGELRDPAGLAQTVRNQLIPAWKDRPVADIAKRDVRDLIVKIRAIAPGKPAPGKRRKAGGPHAARHAFAAARRLFGWAVESDVIEDSPCDGIRGKLVHGAAGKRDRVLTDAELKRVWRVAEATPYPYGPLLHLLIFTGQRRTELSDLRWSEIDLDAEVITLPAARMKAGEAHVVPLAPRAKALLESLPRFEAGDFVFSTTHGASSFSGFSKAKTRLDKAVGEIPQWQLHDLRRTARTGMAQAGVSVFIGELVLSHTQKGVHGVYDLHTYDAEKRDALERWEARLTAIIDPPPANVVELRAAR